MTELTFAEYDRLDALEMARLVAAGEVSAEGLCQAATERARMTNVALGAIVYPMYEQALAAARALDKGTTAERGPLAGVPFLIKDFGSRLAGVPHGSGNRALKDYVPTQDDEMVARWKKAGLLTIGKSSTPEFALMGVTEPWHGPTRTPWNLSRTSGGSSGGAGAAVAAGIVPIASAGDGGGSIRIPASCCGIFGLKPARGRVPAGPGAGEPWQGASVEHVLTRSVRDSAALLDWEQGPDVGAPFFLPDPPIPYLETVKRAAQGDAPKLKIGFSAVHPLGGTVHPDCVSAVQDAAKLFESLGHTVEEVPLPWDGVALAKAYLTMYFGEVGANLADIERHLGRPARASDVEPITWLLGQLGRTFSAADFAIARQSWNVHARALGRFHQQYDLLLMPTIATPPMHIGELQPTGADAALLSLAQRVNVSGPVKAAGMVDKLALQTLDKTPFTQMANLTGLPAVSLPLYWNAEGLPIGVQLVAPTAREDMLFGISAQAEVARPWFDKRPKLG